MFEKLNSRLLDIKTPAGLCDTYQTVPQAEGPFPAVLLLMDAFGPRDYLFKMADRLAQNGYFVLVPNLFYRAKRAPVTTEKFPLDAAGRERAFKDIGPLFTSFTPNNFLEDMNSIFDFLSQQKNLKHGKIALTGYCMGGSLAMRVAAQFPERVAAVASFHAGRLVNDTPESLHLLLPKIKAELYVAHADHDASMPAPQIEQFNKALAAANPIHTAETYKDALHGYTMADLPAGNAEAIERHWKNLLSLLKRHFA
ncbi:MAG: dienelactone hydrolase family protein [Pseudobdellovibrio sp.]